MPAIRKSLPVQLSSRDSTAAKDGLLTNCYVETTPAGACIVKRPGYTLSASLTAGQAQGGITFNGAALWVVGDAISGAPAVISGSTWTAGAAATKPTNGSSAGTATAGYLISQSGALYSVGGRDNADTTISVYKSTNNGTSWSTISTPWTTTTFGGAGNTTQTPNLGVSLGGVLYAIGISTTRGVWKSVDNGVNWTSTNTDLAGGGSLSPIWAMIHNSLIYVFLSSTSGNPQIWSSPDGATWTSVNGSVASLTTRVAFAVLDLGGILYWIGGQTATSSVNNDIWKSVDHGVTWVSIQAAAAFSARAGMAAWSFASKLWIAGGSTSVNGAAVQSDVYSSTDGIT